MDKVQMTIELFESKREVNKLEAVSECLIQEGITLARVGMVLHPVSDAKQCDQLIKRIKAIKKEMSEINIQMQIITTNLDVDFSAVDGKLEDLN